MVIDRNIFPDYGIVNHKKAILIISKDKEKMTKQQKEYQKDYRKNNKEKIKVYRIKEKFKRLKEKSSLTTSDLKNNQKELELRNKELERIKKPKIKLRVLDKIKPPSGKTELLCFQKLIDMGWIPSVPINPPRGYPDFDCNAKRTVEVKRKNESIAFRQIKKMEELIKMGYKCYIMRTNKDANKIIAFDEFTKININIEEKNWLSLLNLGDDY